MSKPIIYVHCGNLQEYREYERNNRDKQCYYILDGEFLRGRWPGEIIQIGTFRYKWNDQEICESIEIHTELWKNSLQNQQDEQEDFDYGV